MVDRMTRVRRDLLAGDVVIAAIVSLASMTAVIDHPADLPIELSVLVGLVNGAPLAVRRRWPVGVVACVLVTSVAALVSGVIPDFAASAPAVAIGCATYIVGTSVAGARSIVTAVVCLTTMIAVLLVTAGDLIGVISGVGFGSLTVGAPWLVGYLLRERRLAAARTAAQAANQAVSDERLRIARELHDIVAHSMSLIAVKAAIANHVAEARPQETREALRVIEATSRAALQQLRQAVGTLRDEEEYAPAPGLADLPALAEQAAAGGVEVKLDVHGEAEVPEAVGLSAYRIVQEALTNVVKHAAPASCRVQVIVDPATVQIEVTDDGRRAAAPGGGGHGLVGIRERAAVYGGAFAAGPCPDGGFRLSVELPYGRPA
jgi:signal transduction histidine kinase